MFLGVISKEEKLLSSEMNEFRYKNLVLFSSRNDACSIPRIRIFCSKFTDLPCPCIWFFNSITGIFKNLFLEFEEQLKVVIQHFEESSDYKFTGAYVVQKFEELLNVHISPRQCQTYLGRLHNLVKPDARALIKFNSKKARVRVNNFNFILSHWFSTNWSFHNASSTPWNQFFLGFIARLITLTRSSFNLHA